VTRGAAAGRRSAAPPAPPLCIGHRGASALAPENTLAAFETAIVDGADGLEFDVRLTRDGVPIVLHDAALDRTTSGRGAVAALDLASIRRLDAGAWFGARFRGERVPTLAETLDLARGRCAVNIELKEEGGDAVSLARAMLCDPRWPWHAAARLGAQVAAPKQYWRSQPREYKDLFENARTGQR